MTTFLHWFGVMLLVFVSPLGGMSRLVYARTLSLQQQVALEVLKDCVGLLKQGHSIPAQHMRPLKRWHKQQKNLKKRQVHTIISHTEHLSYLKVSRSEIESMVSHADEDLSEAFIKDAPVFAYKVPFDVSALPQFIRDNLGTVDSASYDASYFIILQFNGETADFYPVSAAVFLANYATVTPEQVAERNAHLYENLTGFDGFNQLLDQKDQKLLAISKTKATQMIRLSKLGFATSTTVEIDAPWGGTQTKTEGKDGFVVLDQSPYLVNADSSGLPIGYRPKD